MLSGRAIQSASACRGSWSVVSATGSAPSAAGGTGLLSFLFTADGAARFVNTISSPGRLPGCRSTVEKNAAMP